MSINLINRDSSFFEVIAPDNNTSFTVLTKDIISFSVDEEIGKVLTGSLKLYDPEHVYSRLFRTGAKLICSWGYKDPDTSVMGMLQSKDKEQVYGSGYRQKVIGHVQSPSGGGSSGGEITYNVNFYGREVYGNGEQKIHTSPTKKRVISDVFTSLGIPAERQYINFFRGSENVTPTTYPVQWESDFAFLLRCSKEWGSTFRVGQDSKGNAIGMFAEFDTAEYNQFAKVCAGSTHGGAVLLNYKGSPCNVKEYTWQNRMGMDGSGDNVQIVMVNGQAQFYRYNAETQSVQVWKLNPDKIRKALEDRDTTKDKLALMKDWMKASTFEEVKWAFDPSTETTAPQGAGYTMSVKMIGNAHVTAGIEALFGDYQAGVGGGFPDFCYPKKGKKRIKFWVMKVKHTVDASGYNMDLELVDSFVLNNGSMVG